MSSDQDTLSQSYAYGKSTLGPNSLSSPLKTYLYGYPIAHSFSPALHATMFKHLKMSWTYELVESTDKADFLPKLKASDCIGAGVTMPHKVTFLSEVDDVTEEARMIGAINTIFIRADESGRRRYIGTNTDSIGVREAFLQNFPNLLATSTGRPALVIGGGGACRSSIYTLDKWLGASKIYLVNRLDAEVTAVIEEFVGRGFKGEFVHVRSVEQAKGLETPTLVVSTVPDHPPKEAGELVARDITAHFLERPEKGYILDMCYHPNPVTALLKLATEKGWNVLPGTEAMIHQGIAQEVLWAEKPLEEFPVEHINTVIRGLLEKH